MVVCASCAETSTIASNSDVVDAADDLDDGRRGDVDSSNGGDASVSDADTDGDSDGDSDGELEDTLVVEDGSDSSEELERVIAPGLEPETFVLPPEPAEEPVILPAGIHVRVGSFNVYSAQLSSAEAIGELLGGLELDWVGLQECGAELALEIAAAAGFPHVYGAGTPILSRTPLLNAETHSLTGSSRNVIHAETEIDGVRFSVYNTHLSWDAGGDREARVLVDEHLAEDENPYLVMTGDFNDEHLSTQITILEEVVRDAFTTLGWQSGERISWPSSLFDDSEGSQLIDLVFFPHSPSPLVITGDVLNLHPILSDHKPVITELLFPALGAEPFDEDPFAASRAVWREFPPEEERPANLIADPGAEDGGAAWTFEGGGVIATSRRSSLARTGEALFTGAEDSTPTNAPWSSGFQQVDLSLHGPEIDEGRGVLYVSGWIQASYETEDFADGSSNVLTPTDSGEIVVEVLDSDDQLLWRASSGHRDPLRYEPYVERITLPVGARSARFTWLSHNRLGTAGLGNDATFDDLYLGFDLQAPAPSSGNLLGVPGAESTSEAWSLHGWSILPDLVPYGLALYPAWSSSGRGYFFAGAPFGFDDGLEDATLSQTVDLSSSSGAIDQGTARVRWGGRLRSYAALARVEIALEFLNSDGSVGLRIPGAEVGAAEWTSVEFLTQIPAGAASARLVMTSDVSVAGSGTFADELFVSVE
jgi:endonuclease/exonuclease/phosphatase family metal-dependent hydrolase